MLKFFKFKVGKIKPFKKMFFFSLFTSLSRVKYLYLYITKPRDETLANITKVIVVRTIFMFLKKSERI